MKFMKNIEVHYKMVTTEYVMPSIYSTPKETQKYFVV